MRIRNHYGSLQIRIMGFHQTATTLNPFFIIVTLLLTPKLMNNCNIILCYAYHIRIGTRPSPLARQQAESVATILKNNIHSQSSTKETNKITTELILLNSSSESNPVVTRSESLSSSLPKTSKYQIQNQPLAMSVTDFTGIIDNAVLNGVVDIGVHSLKDLPPLNRWHESIDGTSSHHNLKLAAYLPRTTPMDILIGSSSITSIPLNARVGTSSTRRQAQLLNQRPDLSLVNLRGNVQARIDAWKDGTVDAIILAQSGIDRLGIRLIGDDGIEYEYCQLTPKDMIPAPGQGIVGVVCRSDNQEILDILKMANVDDWTSRIIASAELSCLNQVDGFASYKSGGRPPIGAYMEFMPQLEQYIFRGMLARPDGKQVVKLERIISMHECATEESACAFGLEIGKSLIELAGHDFWNGYENDTLNEDRRE